MPAVAVLVVEDNEVNLKLISFLLKSRGHEVRVATNAHEAMAALQAMRPRLILMDLALPGIDGFQLTRTIKSAPETRDIPVVALTAYAMKGDEEKARAAGCDGYITKPFDIRAFMERIAAFLG